MRILGSSTDRVGLDSQRPRWQYSPVKSKPIKLIALDLDGTLLDSRGEIPARNRDVLQAASERGVIVALASGRMTDCISPFEDKLGLDCPVIGYNGGMVRGTQEEGRSVLFHRPLEARYGRELINYCRERYMLNFYCDDILYAEETAELRKWADIYSDQTGAVYSFVPNLEPFVERDPTKLIVITDPAERNRLHDEWVPRWGKETTIVRTNPEYLEFMNLRTDKGVALEALCRTLGISMAETMALGDGDNDAPMLAAAGLGIAMANATPVSKKSARVVSELTNDDCAVADAVERYVMV